MPCSKSLILDSAGYFFYEHGCEGDSRIAFGCYEVGSDSRVRFSFLPFSGLPPIQQITSVDSPVSGSTMVTLAFYDRFGDPYCYGAGISLVDTGGNHVEVRTDSLGRIYADTSIYKQFFVAPFLYIYDEAEAMSIGSRSKAVVFALPEMFLMYGNPVPDDPTDFDLVIRHGGLYDRRTRKPVFRNGD